MSIEEEDGKLLKTFIQPDFNPTNALWAAVKWGQKWPTLIDYFSVDVDPKIPKFYRQLPRLPNYANKYKYGTHIFDK